MKKLALCLVLSLLVPSMASAQNGKPPKYIGDKNEIEKILSNIRDFSGYVMASDYDAIADSYTEDGKIFPNNLKIIEGREAIRHYWVLPEGDRTSSHVLQPVEIKIIGDEAYDYGYYEGKTLKKNGDEFSWKGKYVIVWRKAAGEWKMYLDIWNRVAPQP